MPCAPTTGDVEAPAAKTDTHRGMLVELRADGCQTLIPPSLHPSGERVVWERRADAMDCGRARRADAIRPDAPDGADAVGAHAMRPPAPAERVPPQGHAIRPLAEGFDPARVTAGALKRAVGQVAAAALLARHWPGQGTRDETALALCGMLLRAGWDDEEADRFVGVVARIAGDEEWRERGSKAKHTRQRLDAGETVWGAPALAERLAASEAVGADGIRPLPGAAVVARARAWLGIGDVPPGEGEGEGEGGMGTGTGTRTVSGQPGQPGQPGQSGALDPPLSFGTRLSAYESRPLRPLWGGRLYLGKLTLLDGDPELGKSYVALDLAARITTGRPMPDGSPAAAEGQAGVVYLSAEDDPADTLRPRLEAAGGDPAWVQHLNTAERLGQHNRRWARPLTLRDLDIIRGAVRETQARLVVVDPFAGFLDDKTNSFRDQDVRAILAPLAQLAQEVEAAFLIIRHLNKTAGTKALYRGGGSIGIIGAARVGLYAARDPDDPQRERVVLACSKSNLGPRPPAVVYRIAAGGRCDNGDSDSDGHDDGVGAPGMRPLPAMVEWLGVSAQTADALALAEMGAAATCSGETSALGEAVAFLREQLADHEPHPARDVRGAAEHEGISEKTLRNARRMIGATKRFGGFGKDGTWLWQLPADEPAVGTVLPQTARPATDGATAQMSVSAVSAVSAASVEAPARQPGSPANRSLLDTSVLSAGGGEMPASRPAPCSAPPATLVSTTPQQEGGNRESPTNGTDGTDGTDGWNEPRAVSASVSGASGTHALADYAASVYALEQRARGQAGRGCEECGDGWEDGGDRCALPLPLPVNTAPRDVGAHDTRPLDDTYTAEGTENVGATGMRPSGECHDLSPEPCPKTGRAHEYALLRDVHYHPVCIECGEADLTRTVRDPADEHARRFAGKGRAG